MEIEYGSQVVKKLPLGLKSKFSLNFNDLFLDFSNDKNLILVFNGEIYNYLDLK